MNKKILLIAITGLLTIGIVGMAVISSYGSITGYATVEQGISIDIYGSSNDESYDLKTVHQGETVHSPKIKLKNSIDEPVNVNITFEIMVGSAGSGEDLEFSIVNENKTERLTNPITIPPEDLYFYVEHMFQPDAELGNYTFEIEVMPA
ncbi:MAG: hypothetical protein GTN40_03235 [Candidatus Aenigmarchaeota archaeon]|nr:hypothetical protein [Candidatus Aenigmarchaeota archaeon]